MREYSDAEITYFKEGKEFDTKDLEKIDEKKQYITVYRALETFDHHSEKENANRFHNHSEYALYLSTLKLRAKAYEKERPKWDYLDYRDAWDEGSVPSRFIVKVSGGIKARKELVSFLKKEGFQLNEGDYSTEETVERLLFPITINMVTWSCSVLHTVTAAAAAASSRLLISEETFYREFKHPRCTFEAYCEEVWNSMPDEIKGTMKKSDFTEKTEEILLLSYKGYITGEIGSNPQCLVEILKPICGKME